MAAKAGNSVLLSSETKQRLRLYQPLLKLWFYKQTHSLTPRTLSEYLQIPLSVILSDLAYCVRLNGSTDNPLPVAEVLEMMDRLLEENPIKEALLIGAGRLGNSLLRDDQMTQTGLKIMAAFDIDPDKVGSVIAGIKIQNIDKLPVFAQQMHLRIAIIATPPAGAVAAMEHAIAAGIKVLWNFSQHYIPAAPGIVLQNTISLEAISLDFQRMIARV